MPPRAPTLNPLSKFLCGLATPGVVKVPPLGPVKLTPDTVPLLLLVRLLHPPSGPIYQAPGAPVGHHCACAWAPPNITASAAPAPSSERLVILNLRHKHACDDGWPATRWRIFVTPLNDSKRFLPQRLRLPGNRCRTPR